MFYVTFYVVCSSLDTNSKHNFFLEMKTNLLEGVDDRRGVCCAVILEDGDKKRHWADTNWSENFCLATSVNKFLF
jgi:hypothetical protein